MGREGGRGGEGGDNVKFLFRFMFFVKGVQGAHFLVAVALEGLNFSRGVLDVTDCSADVTRKSNERCE